MRNDIHRRSNGVLQSYYRCQQTASDEIFAMKIVHVLLEASAIAVAKLVNSNTSDMDSDEQRNDASNYQYTSAAAESVGEVDLLAVIVFYTRDIDSYVRENRSFCC